MVETICSSSSSLMLYLCESRASASLPVVFAASASAFGSCKEGWYYRCLGSERMLLYKQKKNQGPKGNRLLISINVVGSAGPIRFVVNEEEVVAAVIDTALKSYARESRLPILGSDLNEFFLYCPIAGSDALSPWEKIGSQGSRNFMLWKKPNLGKDGSSNEAIAKKGGGNLKSWINKSLNLKISSH